MESSVEDIDFLDPFPDIHSLFVYYNEIYFTNSLGACSVEWSSARMTLCAGVCEYRRNGGCKIKLSEPLLKFRPISDLKETLLHEMIHAFLFLSKGLRDREDHGPNFLRIMHRINSSNVDDFQRPSHGYHIGVFHTFSTEVDFHRKHHWTCARCRRVVKRAQNRTPSASDCRTAALSLVEKCSDARCLWHVHERQCGGEFVKTAEPEGYVDRRKKTKTGKDSKASDITNFFQAEQGKKEPEDGKRSGEKSMLERLLEKGRHLGREAPLVQQTIVHSVERKKAVPLVDLTKSESPQIQVKRGELFEIIDVFGGLRRLESQRRIVVDLSDETETGKRKVKERKRETPKADVGPASNHIIADYFAHFGSIAGQGSGSRLCPVCDMELPDHFGNDDVNKHVDSCLAAN